MLYSLVAYSTVKQAWLTTDNVTCDHSENCFGCCFAYPQRSDSCPTASCDFSRDIVIRCSKLSVVSGVINIKF